MPVPLKILDVTNIVITNGGANSWTVSIMNPDTTELGWNENGVGYTDGYENTIALPVSLILSTGVSYSGSDTTYITISYDSTSVVVKFFGTMAEAFSDPLYIDTNGCLYEDSDLQIPYSDIEMLNESILSSDSYVDDDVVGETEDFVGLSDSFDEDNEYSTEDIITVKDTIYVEDEHSINDMAKLSDDITTRIGNVWSERANPSTSNWTEK